MVTLVPNLPLFVSQVKLFDQNRSNDDKFFFCCFFKIIFTICLIVGDSTNQVHMEGYQVSNQCMALVRDSCLVPTKDAPELGSIRESSDKQYVPDVYYKVSETLFTSN